MMRLRKRRAAQHESAMLLGQAEPAARHDAGRPDVAKEQRILVDWLVRQVDCADAGAVAEIAQRAPDADLVILVELIADLRPPLAELDVAVGVLAQQVVSNAPVQAEFR